MADHAHDELKLLSLAQRTVFHALKRRFGARLGFKDADLLYTVRRTFVPPHYAAGKSILHAGDCLDLFTVLGAGTVKVTCTDGRGRTVILQMVADGHAFGLPSLVRRLEPRRFGAVAQSQSLVGLVTRDALQDIIERLDTGRRLRLLTYGWQASIGLLLEKRLLLSLPVAERIWYTLGRLALRFPAATVEANTIGLPLTQRDIGQLVGATRSTVNRKLKLLGRATISLRRGRYVVHRQPPCGAPASFTQPAPVNGPQLTDDLTRRVMLSRLQQHAASIGLAPKAAQAFVEHARLVIYAPGTELALPDRSEALSLLLSGAARVECPGPCGEALTLLFAKPGWLIVGGSPVAGHVGFRTVAYVESCAAILTRDGLAHVVEAMSAGEFLRFLSFGWRVLSHHAWRQCCFLMMTEKERVFDVLKQLALDFPASHEDGTIIDLPLARADLARLVAASESSVSRLLLALERDGRIAFVNEPSKRIVVVGQFSHQRAA